jgi:hypothetical protein
VVQQNASLVEEASAATESMKEQAALLLQTVARFNLGEEADGFASLHPLTAPAPGPVPLRIKPGARLAPAYAALRGARGKSAANSGWQTF